MTRLFCKGKGKGGMPIHKQCSVAASHEKGIPMTLEEITSQMQSRVAEKGAIDGKVVKFDFGDDGVMTIDGGKSPAEVNNDNTDADCTVIVDKDMFESIAAGEENAQMAFMSGKLKVEGDMGIAMQLGTLLG